MRLLDLLLSSDKVRAFICLIESLQTLIILSPYFSGFVCQLCKDSGLEAKECTRSKYIEHLYVFSSCFTVHNPDQPTWPFVIYSKKAHPGKPPRVAYFEKFLLPNGRYECPFPDHHPQEHKTFPDVDLFYRHINRAEGDIWKRLPLDVQPRGGRWGPTAAKRHADAAASSSTPNDDATTSRASSSKPAKPRAKATAPHLNRSRASEVHVLSSGSIRRVSSTSKGCVVG